VILTDEEENVLSIPRSFFHETPKEGDAYSLTLSPSPQKRAEMHEKISSLFDKLKKKGETEE